MGKHLALFIVWFQVVLLSPGRAQAPRDLTAPRSRPDSPPAPTGAASAIGFRCAPTGLTLRRPYARGKVPVVFIHGLWATPGTWNAMIDALEADSRLTDAYQFWTFGYSTGDPIPYSASLLRKSLVEARRQFDPASAERSFDSMVLVGHSMGGLLAKLLVVDSGTRFWRMVSERPFEELVGEPDDRDLVGQALLIKPLPGIRRVVFIATPHRGSRLDRGWLQSLSTRLVQVKEPVRSAYDRLLARNGPEFFKEDFRKRLPTSIEELEWDAPFLRDLSDLGATSAAKLHSIIAVRSDLKQTEPSDGLVAYSSAHLDGASSEIVIPSGHFCQGHPAAVGEVRRVLVEHSTP